jgi:predicted Zn-dependent protease
MPPLHLPRLRPLLTAALLAAALALSACDSAEERAEQHYQSALALIAAGDTDRALVELRNVFKLNGFHKEARKLYADTVLAQGKVAEAYGQYLRLIEQYPDTPEVRRDLAQLAIGRGDWEEAERHGREALRLAPDLAGVAEIRVALDYRKAVLDKDETARQRLAEEARAQLDAGTGDRIARRLVIDWLIAGPAPLAAIPELDRAIEREPAALEFYGMKLRLLAQAEDIEGTGALLQQMVDRFPDNEEARAALIGWYIARQDFDGAETFLRKLAGAPTAAPDGHIAVIQLLQAARGPEAALAEIAALIAANDGTPNADVYRGLKAGLDFEAGRQAEAMAALETVLAAAEPSDQTRRLKVLLAHMLEETGNRVGARARIEEVLAEDRTMVEALKMRAAWLIAEDKPGEAILDLRAALDQAPRDARVLTLMAEAHERDGAAELAGERLALAVEVSGAAPEESLRYAHFLLARDRSEAAEQVLADARRANPAHPGVLAAQAELFLARQDWPRVQEIVAALRGFATPEAERAAAALEAALLQGQNRAEDGIALLQSQADRAEGDSTAVTAVVEAQVRAGKLAEARSYLDAELARHPGDRQLQMVSAGLHALAGQTAEAEAVFRDLLAETPGDEAVTQMLYRLLAASGRGGEARAVLAAALEANPGSGLLRWMRAGELEQAGDIDGAIALYEAMYAEDSANVIVANNLASLITTHRSDPESLERAYAVARRLRESDEPAFQDTYGWIEHRRGNHSEALPYLEAAARGLPGDAPVQIRLGLLYVALDRPEDARRQLTAGIALAGPGSTLPQVALAQQALDALPPPPQGGTQSPPPQGGAQP